MSKPTKKKFKEDKIKWHKDKMDKKGIKQGGVFLGEGKKK